MSDVVNKVCWNDSKHFYYHSYLSIYGKERKIITVSIQEVKSSASISYVIPRLPVTGFEIIRKKLDAQNIYTVDKDILIKMSPLKNPKYAHSKKT